jgi:DNA-binding NarL/FixJ family response regulator
VIECPLCFSPCTGTPISRVGHSTPAELLLAVRAALEGKTYFTPQLAATLGISPRTVDFHKYQMMESLGLRTNAELVHFAIKHGLVER